MKTVNPNHITLPLDFKIACFIFKITAKQMLQTFINHATIFDSFSLLHSKGFTEASELLTAYALGKNGLLDPGEGFENHIRPIATALARIIATGKIKTEKPEVLRQESTAHVIEISAIMEHIYTPQQTLQLDHENVLLLSPDFCVLCEMYNCRPIEFLDDFMDNISLPNADARAALKREERNFNFELFRIIAGGLGSNNYQPAVLSATQIAFHEQISKLNQSLDGQCGLKKRTAILSRAYQSYYLKMNY